LAWKFPVIIDQAVACAGLDRVEEAIGKACRLPDGAWRIVKQ
jgi:surface antigen